MGNRAIRNFKGGKTRMKHLPSIIRWWWILGQREGNREQKAHTGTARGVLQQGMRVGQGAEWRERCQGFPTPWRWEEGMATCPLAGCPRAVQLLGEEMSARGRDGRVKPVVGQPRACLPEETEVSAYRLFKE